MIVRFIVISTFECNTGSAFFPYCPLCLWKQGKPFLTFFSFLILCFQIFLYPDIILQISHESITMIHLKFHCSTYIRNYYTFYVTCQITGEPQPVMILALSIGKAHSIAPRQITFMLESGNISDFLRIHQIDSTIGIFF